MDLIQNNRDYKLPYLFLINCLSAIILLLTCSKIKFFLWEVPFTMQTFAIFLIGYIYDKRVIILSVLLSFTLFDSQFLVDKFSLFTHTFGYKFSFILSGLFINYYKNKINNQALLFMLASVIIFIFGVSYLGFYIDDMRKAVYVGFLPFIIPDIIKISAVISIIRFFKLN